MKRQSVFWIRIQKRYMLHEMAKESIHDMNEAKFQDKIDKCVHFGGLITVRHPKEQKYLYIVLECGTSKSIVISESKAREGTYFKDWTDIFIFSAGESTFKGLGKGLITIGLKLGNSEYVSGLNEN